jgi:hypothetical protein
MLGNQRTILFFNFKTREQEFNGGGGASIAKIIFLIKIASLTTKNCQ